MIRCILEHRLPAIRPLRHLATAASAVLLAGCSAGPSPDRPASTLTIAYCCGDRALSPAMDVAAKFLVFLPLIGEDERGDPVGRLAQRFEPSADHRSWTFHLRRDLRWHDGTPVTAHDVAFTLYLLRHPDVNQISPRVVVGVEAPDDSTVVVSHAQPTDVIQHWSWYVIYPRHLLEELDPAAFYDWDFWTAPVGAGPYRFVRREPQVMMEFEAVPDFPLWTPRVERVVLRFSDQAGMTDLLAGRADVLDGVTAEDALKLSLDPRFEVYFSLHGYGAVALQWRHDHALFEDGRVRRALTLAVDRRALIRALDLPDQVPVFDGIYTNRQIRRGQLPEALPHDPARATALLEAAGWRDADGDGIFDRGGRPFRFTALVAGRELTAAALLLQDQLRRAGIRMEFQMLERNVARERFRARAFDAYLDALGNAPGGIARWYGETSLLGYADAEVAALVERARLEPDPDARDSLYVQISSLLRRDVPVLWLFPQTGRSAAHRRVGGLESPHRVDPLMALEHVWIEEGT